MSRNPIKGAFEKLAKAKTIHEMGMTKTSREDVVIVESRSPSKYEIRVGANNESRGIYDDFQKAKEEAKKIIQNE